MRQITYREAIREALRDEMQQNKDVFLLGEDIAQFGGSYKVTLGLAEEFGLERVRNTPISEAAIVGAAVGAAIAGMRPVAEIMYVDFTTLALDQIVNQAAKIRYMTGGQVKVPLVVRTQGGSGRSAAAHHSQSLEAWFAHVPGLKVVMPATPYDAKGLLKAAIRDDNPVIFIEHKLLYSEKGEVPEEDYVVPLGCGILRRQGQDVSIVTYSRMVSLALEAADMLSEEGIYPDVIDLRTLSPIDIDIICDSVKKTGRLLVVHEACRQAGLGAEIAAQVMENAFDYLDAPVCRVAGSDVPMPFAGELERAVVPQIQDIVTAGRTLKRGV